MKIINKKPLIFLGLFLSSLSSLSYASMTCSCSSGKMTVVHDGNTVTYTCSNGGKVQCLIDMR